MTRQYERPALSRAESARCAPAPACVATRTARFAQTLLRRPPTAATLGAAQGEFRQPTCAWSVDFSFAACCATEAFEAGGQPCAFGETTYANCCTDLTPLPPKYWCGDDPSFTDGAGFTCADWAAGEFSCVDDTATYTDGDRSALWAACAASCGLCQEWQGEAACWSGTFSYTSCCTGDGDEDGSPGDENCWTAELAARKLSQEGSFTSSNNGFSRRIDRRHINRVRIDKDLVLVGSHHRLAGCE